MKASTLIPVGIFAALAFILAKKFNAANNFVFLLKGLSVTKFPLIELVIGIGNPSGDSFNVQSIAGEITVNGKMMGTVNSFQKIIIAPNKETLLRLKVEPSLVNIGQTFAQMIQQKQRGNFTIVMKGTANVSGVPIPLNIKYQL